MPIADHGREKEEVEGGRGGNKTSLGDVTQVVTMTTLFEGHRNLTALHASLGFLTTNPKHA